jgi:hypothetical protein
MQMQIFGVYSLSPNPSYLLVVNSKTPNHAIHQIIVLLRERLHTHLDIFNLSLTGSYDSPVTNENVLKSYAGKSVIIFGNSFPYFNQGNKDPWSLLDPWHTGLLIKGGTSVLFTAVSNLEGLRKWAREATGLLMISLQERSQSTMETSEDSFRGIDEQPRYCLRRSTKELEDGGVDWIVPTVSTGNAHHLGL